MNDLFHRGSSHNKRREISRSVLALFAILAASALWYLLRPAAISWIARTSLGCPSRAPIVAAVLRESYDTIPTDGEINASDPFPWTRLATYIFPEPGWVAWESVRETKQLRDSSWLYHWRTTFVDHDFDLVGSIGAMQRPLLTPAEDIDGDGRWELVLEFQATPWENSKSPNVKRLAVVRIGKDDNQIAWIGLIDADWWSRKLTRIKPIWRDEDGDGVKELVFVTVVYKRLPQGGAGFDPPTTVAIFEWDRPGGVLRPRSLPEDAGIISWTPFQSEPVRAEIDADIESLLAKLLPLPEGFGVHPAPPPANSPSTPSDSQ